MQRTRAVLTLIVGGSKCAEVVRPDQHAAGCAHGIEVEWTELPGPRAHARAREMPGAVAQQRVATEAQMKHVAVDLLERVEARVIARLASDRVAHGGVGRQVTVDR